MNNFKVYIHRNKINGKVYIGITCQKGERRWRNNGYGYKSSKYFYSAILKYGWDNFETNILAENIDKQKAEDKERELIKYYNSTDKAKGYNITEGGNVVGNFTQDIRNKMSKKAKERPVDYSKIKKMQSINTGRKMSEEQRLSMIKRLTGRKLSQSHIENIRSSHIGYTHTDLQKKKISESLKDFYSKEENKENLRHRMKELYKNPEMRKKSSLSKLKTNKKIILINNGICFENHIEAGKHYNIQSNKILKNCERKTLSAGKCLKGEPLIWVFFEDYDKDFDYKNEYNLKFSKSKSRKK